LGGRATIEQEGVFDIKIDISPSPLSIGISSYRSIIDDG
jgi:hypothetical protein